MFKKFSLALIGSLLIFNASYSMQSSDFAHGLFLSLGAGCFAGIAINNFRSGLILWKGAIQMRRSRARADTVARTNPRLASAATAVSNEAITLHDRFSSRGNSFMGSGICGSLLCLACLYGIYNLLHPFISRS